MIGIYDYTVLLTYGSLASAVCGIFLSLEGKPFWAIICLMLSGLFDMFDGRVARTKKNRTIKEVSFGIQIDSLADLTAFGVLPCTIGMAIGLNMYFIPIFVLFVLGALIRLAYFNVLEIENLGKTVNEKIYIGLPTTTVSLIFPVIYALKNILPNAYIYIYAGVLLVVAILFVAKFKIKKPTGKITYLFIVLGIIELLLVLRGLHII